MSQGHNPPPPLNAYEQHRQRQFHAPLSETTYSGWPIENEPCVVISETEARTLVVAIDDCRPSDMIAIIKRQPWFAEVLSGIRTTRHLRPNDYIKLSHAKAQSRKDPSSVLRPPSYDL